MKLIKSLYKISKNYWVEINTKTHEINEFIKVDSDKDLKIWTETYISGNEINAIFNLSLNNNSKYFTTYEDKSLNIFSKNLFIEILGKRIIKNLNAESSFITNGFRLRLKSKFIKNVFFHSSTLDDILKEIKQYVFCDHYSVWLYNNKSKYFSKICASFQSDSIIKKEDNESNQIIQFKSGDGYICEKYILNEGTSESLSQIKTVNRIKVSLQLLDDSNKQSFLIVNLFSPLEDYQLRKDTIQVIQETINLKVSRDWLPEIEKKNTLAKTISRNYKLGQFKEFIDQCLETINAELGWEASSIFLRDHGDILMLRSLMDNRKDKDREKLIDDIYYSARSDSFTYNVFKNNEIKYSYDIFNDEQNSHTFDELTKSRPQNWLGIPITTGITSPIGVLRVKNRFNHETQKVVPFNDIDISILESITSTIAHIFNMHYMYLGFLEEKDDEIQKQRMLNEELINFMRTYRHEIKSPLQVITFASYRIKLRMEKLGYFNRENVPKKLDELFDDIDSVGDRLVYVANSLSFNASELIKEKEIRDVFPYSTIIAPVTSFSKLYASKRNKTLDVDEKSIKILQKVKVDPFAGSMAFHIVLDNAIKYAKKYTTIKVSGYTTSEFAVIVIEDFSIVKIEDFEKNKIFEKFYRNKEVEQMTFEGAGIGLALCYEIMEKLNGKILLINSNNPTIFELHYKLF